ncbi:TPA: hypothetical protein HIF66_004720 [Escherichia coli]|nr:hypothetical protein [Escherichia coli]
MRKPYQSHSVWTASRAVILEVSGRWMEAAEAWRRATCVAPRTDWQQFARKRAEHCYRRCRGRV